MAYACPVCAALAPDGEHLAHHLAIVAMTRGGEHETWLDEHADGWRDAEPATVAATATDHAETVEHDLADHAADRSLDAEPVVDLPAEVPEVGADDLDDRAASVLAEAHELTARRRGARGDGTADEEGEQDGDETDSDE